MYTLKLTLFTIRRTLLKVRGMQEVEYVERNQVLVLIHDKLKFIVILFYSTVDIINRRWAWSGCILNCEHLSHILV